MRRDVFRSTLAAGLLVMVGLPCWAQDGQGEADNSFLLTGYGFSTYTDGGDGDGEFSLGLAPIFLFRVTDKFLFEAELEFELEGDAVETEVEYAQIDWLVADGLTVVIGKFLTPFGQFIERQHPAWINKLPTFPLMYKHGSSLVPGSQIGLQVRGGIGLGDSRRFTYSATVSNGYRLAAHHGEEGDEHDEVPEWLKDDHDDHGDDEDHDALEPLFFGAATTSDGNLAFGGRISVIPAKGLEIGVSYLSGAYDQHGELDATTTGIDFSYHHEVFDIRAEWLDNETDRGIADDGDILRAQQAEGWYFQPSLRLAVIPAYFLNRVEAVVRIGQLEIDHQEVDQLAIGLNYYFTGSSIVRVAWEDVDENNGVSGDSWTVMFALGF